MDYLHSAMHIVAAGLGCKVAMVGTEWASFHPSCMNGLENTTPAGKAVWVLSKYLLTENANYCMLLYELACLKSQVCLF